MSDPSLALQGAIHTALSGALMPVPVYDRPPETAAYPFVRIGEDQVIDDGNTCADAWEAFVTVHVWSQEVGMPRAKTIAGQVRDALAAVLDVPGFTAIVGEHRDTRYLNDPDGLTTHAVLTFRYLIDPAE